jgi:hypothetical protein
VGRRLTQLSRGAIRSGAEGAVALPDDTTLVVLRRHEE